MNARSALIALACALTALVAVSPGSARAQSTLDARSELAFTADLTVASKYMTDGFKVGGDNPVWQPSLSADLWNTGISLMFWSALQVDRLKSDNDELDFFARYSHTLFEGSAFAVNLHGFVDYWLYPKAPMFEDEFGERIELPHRQGYKLNAGISLPELIPIDGWHLVPQYNAYYWVHWLMNQRDQYVGGARHELMAHYYHHLPTFIPGAKAQYIGLTGSVSYHDGAFGVAPGWTHSVAQLGTSVHALGCIFTLALNHQWAFKDTLISGDETWSTFSLAKNF